jgi:MFS family permease
MRRAEEATAPRAAAVPPDDGASARRARLAVVLVFLTHGLLTGGWVPHIPLVKERLGVGTGVFGWLLLALAAGGVAAMPLTGALINRFGSAALCRMSGLLMCLGFALPVTAPSELALALALVVFGAALGSLDVAMNAHGVAVEQRLRHAVMSSFHGWYSLGAALGAGAGGAIVGALGETAHVAATVAASLAILAVSSRLLLPSEVDRGLSDSHFAWPTPATLGLGALAFLSLLIEGAMFDWSAIYLRQDVGVPVAVAGLGFAAFSTGMALARFAGDVLRTRFGSVPLVLSSALALAAGLGVALAVPEPGLATVAFGVAGLGVGNIAPVLFAGGGRAEPDAPGRGIAAVTTLGYSGFLLGPPLIGAIAEWTGLRLALGLTVVAALIIALSARAAWAADGPPRP